ncbi:rapunzel 4 [Amia ocellicauda]|uniref:rapunzel 4 n=1 Tax=Amia ocellicauda TaxID=2972642 RepID=UPI0034646A11
MTNQLQKLVAEKKDMVETVMEVFEQGAEVVASMAGDLFPIFQIAAPIVKLALDNVESKEAEFMREQFQKVRDRLEAISEEVNRINAEIKKSKVDAEYFSVEENMTNQFRKYMDILNAKPKFKEVKKKLFLEHFSKTGGEKNLHTLYAAITGDNFSGESILEITLNYEEKSRRPVEEFCARLKQLLCVGLIALMGYAALKGDDEEALLKNWAENMKAVQARMNAVVEDCINSFPEQAKIDTRRMLRDGGAETNQQLADRVLDFLKKKYDWVCWSVRVFKTPSWLLNKIKSKEFHCLTGKSRFQLPEEDAKINLVVSYSASPEPLDKEKIQQLIEEQKKPSVVSMAEMLFSALPACVVHTIKPQKDLGFSCSFTDELHYVENGKNLFVCIHGA